ncbi:toprim domain-containing protein [Olivibacter domesticus]|uniref:Toprim-like n=1 Tax=Olivibacter domesticus TaxID=407022 RepID=A0A1H7IEC7_OLID1|nr:toprim domain-containing protein [Olivibacter domesticus]SEK60856.1 Toprim-like [Olivibacter domesticus]
MENKSEISLQAIKEMRMVDYLASLGIHPAKPPKGDDHWYLSPLPGRKEEEPSFKIDDKDNCWFDHGLGIGGNLVDFGILYHRCDVSEFKARMQGPSSFSFHQPPKPSEKDRRKPAPKIEVVNDKPLKRYPLLQYLQQRHIDIEIARLYCREVTYRLGEKEYYGIGFKNNSGGFEIRNKYVKAASTPKDVTSISNGHPLVNVFEGQFDFLSHMTLTKNDPLSRQDFLILNGTGMFKYALPFLASHIRGHLFLDNGTGGDRLTQDIKKIFPEYADMRQLYKNYGDYNDWLCEVGIVQRQRKGLKR